VGQKCDREALIVRKSASVSGTVDGLHVLFGLFAV